MRLYITFLALIIATIAFTDLRLTSGLYDDAKVFARVPGPPRDSLRGHTSPPSGEGPPPATPRQTTKERADWKKTQNSHLKPIYEARPSRPYVIEDIKYGSHYDPPDELRYQYRSPPLKYLPSGYKSAFEKKNGNTP